MTLNRNHGYLNRPSLNLNNVHHMDLNWHFMDRKGSPMALIKPHIDLKHSKDLQVQTLKNITGSGCVIILKRIVRPSVFLHRQLGLLSLQPEILARN